MHATSTRVCVRERARTRSTHIRKLWTRLHGGSFVTAMAAIGIFDSTVGAKRRRWRRVCASPVPLSSYRGTFIRRAFCDSLSPTRRLSFDPHYNAFRSPPFSDLRASLFLSLFLSLSCNLSSIFSLSLLVTNTPLSTYSAFNFASWL